MFIQLQRYHNVETVWLNNTKQIDCFSQSYNVINVIANVCLLINTTKHLQNVISIFEQLVYPYFRNNI